MTPLYSRSQIPLKTFYAPNDAQAIQYGETINDPGAYPFTRGIRAQPWGWIHRELSGEGSPSRSNEQIKYLIEKGQMGIDVIGDSPSMAHLDPDHPLAAQTVGTQGVSICCLQDYRDLYKDTPLDAITISNSLPAPFAIAGLYLVARELGVSPKKLRGSLIQAPFFAEDCGYAVKMPFALRLRMASDSIEFCSTEMPKFHAFVEDTYFPSEAGLDAVEEMALGFIEIRHVVRNLLQRGVDIDSFAPRIALLVNCSMDFFEEIAKIRASRRLFARMMKEEFGAKDPRSWATVISCHTSGLSLTAQQPVMNIVRGAIQCLALVMAGVQALEISAFDEAYRTPSPESHLIGLRTQQVIQIETGVNQVIDPLGGSYYLESLTDDIEKKIWEMIVKIESMGDPGQLSDKGWFKKFFDDAMERYARQIDNKELKKVGLNVFQIPDHEDTLLKDVAESKIEPCWERIEYIRKHKEKRDPGRVKEVLGEVYRATKNPDENLMPSVIQATKADITIQEISGAMRMAYDWPYDPYGFVDSPI